MILILLGPPGAGKGTQAALISEKYNIPHISTGDIFRQNIKNKTKLGLEAESYIHNGLLVPDELTIKIMEERLNEKDCRNGYLLDGFPRTIFQAESLKKYYVGIKEHIDLVFFLEVSSDLVIKRNTGRRICSCCGRCYHVNFTPPKHKDICDICGGCLIQRKDDTKGVILERLNVYLEQTMPLVDYYVKEKILYKICGDGEISNIFESICKIIDNCN